MKKPAKGLGLRTKYVANGYEAAQAGSIPGFWDRKCRVTPESVLARKITMDKKRRPAPPVSLAKIDGSK